MNYMYKRILFYFAFLIFLATGWNTNVLLGQTDPPPPPIEDPGDIDPENIDIVKPYEPILGDAVRINFSPALPSKEELDRQRPTFKDYYVPNRFLTGIQYEPPTLKPIAYKFKNDEGLVKNFWLRAGYGKPQYAPY